MSENLNGADVLDQVAGFIKQYAVFPNEHSLTAVTLWAAHTHVADLFYVTPRLILDSAEAGSGKTRVLELLNLLCRAPEMMLSPTTAALFRLIEEGPITVLFDEVDAIFNPKNSGNYEDLRALLNAGYKRSATIPRCVGDAAKMKVQRFKVFSPVALAGIAGNMPTTITTRAVTVHMRKRGQGETVKPYEEEDAETEAKPILDALVTWTGQARATLRGNRPLMPTGVVDRPAEVWRALVAVAYAAGGDWPDRAREACQHFVLGPRSTPQTFGVRLLTDLLTVFAGADRLPTVEVLEKLLGLEDSAWTDVYGKPLDARRLARELGRYEVAPVPFKDGNNKTVKGYTTFPVETKENVSAGLADAWSRYLPPEAAFRGNGGNTGNAAGQTPDQPLPLDGLEVTGVTGDGPVTPVEVTGDRSVTSLTSTVTPVTPVTPNPGRRVAVVDNPRDAEMRALWSTLPRARATPDPTRTQVAKDHGEFVIHPNAVYVGRRMPGIPGEHLAGTKFGNPHLVGGDRNTPCRVPTCAGAVHNRAEAIDLYRRHLDEHPELIEAARKQLAGRTLACWCPPELDCHADVLLAIANADPA